MIRSLKQNFVKFISCILIIAIILPIITSPVEAAQSKQPPPYYKPSVIALTKNSWPDWQTAIFYDGLAWNAFHNKVQEDIVISTNGIKSELSLSS